MDDTKRYHDGTGDTATSRRVSRRDVLRATGVLAAGGLLAGRSVSAFPHAPPFETQIFPNYFPIDVDPDEVGIGGKLAVIAGASRGIGRAAGEDLLSRGVSVIGTSRNPTEVPNQPAFPLLQLDITDPASVAGFVAALST
jgi:hypothetical protein